MHSGLTYKNAVAAIRVSTTKQGTDGDSPDAQKEQIERFAQDKGIVIKKFFVFMESASKEQQPMQEAVDYCKNPKNGIELFIIKSIDRFTRGGSLPYDLLKTQLEANKVSLVDIYGIISSETVNTLDHLGFEYKWSRYSPSKKSEILEAERSKDELRDIMSRMIGAEIRYTKMGYWMRQPPYGYQSKKVDSAHGKRSILIPEPTEAKFIRPMFEMRASGAYSDTQIAEKLNYMGFQTRAVYRYDRDQPNKVAKQTGHKQINDKHLWRLVRNPIYTGINMERWTNNLPVKCVFEGLVSVELFNKANKGRRIIKQSADGRIDIIDNKDTLRACKVVGGRSSEFAFRKYVMCPECRKPLLGSASRGKSGKYYPAYHCNNRGHKFRVSKDELETHVFDFVADLKIDSESLDLLFSAVENAWEHTSAQYIAQIQKLDAKIVELREEAITTVEKIKVLSSPTAMKYMEEDLVKIESQIAEVENKKIEFEAKKPLNISKVLARAKYFIEHLDKLITQQIDPVRKAQFFGALFDTLPTYEEIKYRTLKTPLFIGADSGRLTSQALHFSYGDPC